jgi:hypothetical protein
VRSLDGNCHESRGGSETGAAKGEITVDWLAIWFYACVAVVICYAGKQVWDSLQYGEWERESRDRVNLYELMERDKEEKK